MVQGCRTGLRLVAWCLEVKDLRAQHLLGAAAGRARGAGEVAHGLCCSHQSFTGACPFPGVPERVFVGDLNNHLYQLI